MDIVGHIFSIFVTVFYFLSLFLLLSSTLFLPFVVLIEDFIWSHFLSFCRIPIVLKKPNFSYRHVTCFFILILIACALFPSVFCELSLWAFLFLILLCENPKGLKVRCFTLKKTHVCFCSDSRGFGDYVILRELYCLDSCTLKYTLI